MVKKQRLNFGLRVPSAFSPSQISRGEILRFCFFFNQFEPKDRHPVVGLERIFHGKRVELRSVQAFSLFATASNRWFVVYASRNFRLRNLVRDGCQQCSNIRWSPLRKPGDIAFLIDGGGQLAGHYEIQSLVRRKCWPPLGPSSFPRV